MDSGRKDTLRKGTIDSYIMRSPKSLGNLNYIRIWHDNSGRDKYASWYLSALIIIDLQTGQRTEFSCNRWLAVEKEDGAIERVVQASGARSCQEMLIHTAGKQIMENHVWFSIFFKSHRSRYSRKERTSTAFALLFLAMLADAVWYGIMPEEPTKVGLKLAFIKFTPEQLYIGCMVSLVTIVPTFVLMFLFKKSRRMRLRKNRVVKALNLKSSSKIEDNEEKVIQSDEESESGSNESSSDESDSSDEDETSEKGSGSEKGSVKNEDSDDSEDSENSEDSKNSENESSETEDSENDDSGKESNKDEESENEESVKEVIEENTEDLNDKDTKIQIEASKTKQYRNFGLPFIFRIIAWIICLATIIASCIFLIAYGISFGNDVTHQWLTSMIVAFFFIILVIEPLKVGLFSCCISILCRKLDLDNNDDVEDDEEDLETNLEMTNEGSKRYIKASREPIGKFTLP